ncbi:ubiquitin-conjugating enzyme E2 S [Bimuria novae-zelandiae CBS 107.79]|uniref:Ubiquitin-conjugating enzyme E2 S n=1 Tax=Bimuria novae-zelandiae CBS 107.79 TaxID=1447943 RepID=A0A6A5UNL2_9PLEO|nr:ubiquitin-conjugating enzyme E2 S [Bimuria novae-zelandiae CBS 107.79]
MNSKSLRRLAADHGSLHTAGLPPNYLFPPSQAAEMPSDLTSLDILLAGPEGTPYAHGVWRLHLDIPPTYPTAPPTAAFRTRLWHPNIDEATGAVCVETLKRDWSSSLKLRDVLVTISCLLIQPNPASALNEAAGKLASEDWDGFCRRAKLMTEIHAAIPSNILEEVRAAQSRGDEKQVKAEMKAVEAKLNGKGKGKVKITPAKVTPATAKVRTRSVAEDEENMRNKGVTAEESDSETDWIPGPGTFKASDVPRIGRSNIFGIQGLDSGMQHGSPEQSRVTNSFHCPTSASEEKENDISDPFITIPSKRSAQHSFSLRVPFQTKPAAYTPELLKFSDKNPFSAIQPNNQTHPLLKEFSWSWADGEIMHETGSIKTGETKSSVRKRLATDDFEERRTWELKKFKKAGFDLKRYNCGDFGPKTGLGRL